MVVHKIRELKERGLRLGLLTNNVKEFGEHWRATFPIEMCDEIVDSSHVGMRKPERAIYELTCTRMGIAPDEAVFVDDNADNIAAARAFGMEAVHFGERAVGRARRARRDPRTGAACRRPEARAALRVAVHGVRRERREAHRDVLGALGRRVLDPLARVGDHGLARAALRAHHRCGGRASHPRARR